MLITLGAFLLILSILVMIHELGHFLVAKKFGIRVEEFGFGLPPRAIGKKIGETIYSLNWLPIGGFVRLLGEDQEDLETKPKLADKKRTFYGRPVWQRAAVIVAGVIMNFILAVLIISYLFTQGVSVPVDRVHIEQVESGSPAELAGIKPRDVVLAINGKTVVKGSDFIAVTNENLETEVTLSILRGASLTHYGEVNLTCDSCEKLEVKLVPRKEPPFKKLASEEKTFFTELRQTVRSFFHIAEPVKPEPPREGPIGVAISTLETKIYPWYLAPVYGPWESLQLSWMLLGGIGFTLWKLITFQSVSQYIAGPIGIAQITGEAVKYGLKDVLQLMGLLSLNLAIVNILPFPALDGGRLLFVFIEGTTGKKLKAKWERYVHQVGMVILLLLIVLVTLNDIIRIFSR